MTKMLSVLVGFLSLMGVIRSGAEEPACVSKFDYDYKILNKVIDLERETQSLKTRLKEQEDSIQELNSERKRQGSTYTVWGKKTCPGNGSSLVYSGFMAGPHHQQTGSGSNYLCLTSAPLWDHYEEQTASGGKLYGVEYQFWDHRATGASAFFGQNVYNQNAPCAVWHITRGTTIMIPGRNECFSGWTKEYSGYLVSGQHSDSQASEYICLNRSPDFVVGKEGNDDECRLYFVEGVCGKSLPCPPYVNGRELACVVCSF